MAVVIRTGPSLLALCGSGAFDADLVNRLLGLAINKEDVVMGGTEEEVEELRFTAKERQEQEAALRQLELAHRRGMAQQEKEVTEAMHRRFTLDLTKTFPSYATESMVGNMYVNPLGLPIPCSDKVWAENFLRLEETVEQNQFIQGMFLDDQFMSFALGCARESYDLGIVMPVTFVPFFTDVSADLGGDGLVNLVNSPTKGDQYLKGYKKLLSFKQAPFLKFSELIRGAGFKLENAPFIGVIINITRAHWLFAIYHPAVTIDKKTQFNMFLFDPLAGLSTLEKYQQHVRAVREFVVAFYAFSMDNKNPDVRNAFFVEQTQSKEVFFVRNRPQQGSGTNNCGIYASLFAINFLRSMTAKDRDVKTIVGKVVSGIYDESQETVFRDSGGMRPEDVRRKMSHNWIQLYKKGR